LCPDFLHLRGAELDPLPVAGVMKAVGREQNAGLLLPVTPGKWTMASTSLASALVRPARSRPRWRNL
jgi:hypothetical protein